MRMNKKKEIVPKLRFPEFSKSYWGITRLNVLADKITERNKDDSIKRVFTNSATEGVINQEEYFDRNIANKNNLTNYFVVEKGDYVYNPRISTTAPVGPISKNKLGIGVMSPLYTVFRFRNKENDFYEHFFLTNLWHVYIKNLSNTGARHDRITISVDNFMKMPLPYASPEEQQKIADCLSSIDDLIDAESRKLKALEKYKKGLMQKLFPAEGKTLPEWRFPEFQGCGEWQKSTIAEVTSYVDYRGKTPVKSKDGVFLITAKNIKMGYIDYNASKEYIPKEQYSAVMSRGIPQLGDVLITTEAPCGNVAQIDKVDVALAQRVIKYRGDKNKINNTFLKYVFLSPVFQSELKKNSTGGIVGGIKGSVLHQMSIKYPDDITEQQKIVGCLSEVDTIITEQSNKVEQLKAHKKGLMQGLFPSLEEADV